MVDVLFPDGFTRTLQDVLDEAITGKRCVQAWIGHANVLFMGFGDEVLPPVPKGGRHSIPPYELQTRFADWWVYDHAQLVGGSQGDWDYAHASAGRLVGLKVVEWRFDEDFPNIQIQLEGDVLLRTAPYPDSDEYKEDAWLLRIPVYYVYATLDGRVGSGRRDAYFLEDDATE